MSVQVKCPSRDCDQQLMLSPQMAGKKGQCPKCGKTFQIPANFGQKKSGGSASKKSSSGAMSSDDLADYLVEDDGSPQTGSMAEVETLESYEAEVVDDYEDYEDPQPRRRRRRDDDYDYEDDDEDDDDFSSSARQKGGMTKTRKRKLLNVGFLIVAIATCVFGGGLAMAILAELFAEISTAAESAKMFKAASVFIKIAQVFVFLGSLALVTGYVFCIFAPNKHASLGLIIATLSVGAINMILRLIFRMIPGFAKGVIYDRSWFAVFGGQGQMHGTSLSSMVAEKLDVGQKILFLFMELGSFAEFILLALFMAAIARMQKDKAHRRDCMRTVWFITAVVGVVFVMSIFMMFDYSDKWPIYLIRTMNWGANGVLTIAMIFHIMNLFYSWKSTKTK